MIGILGLLIAYLLGDIPFGYVLVKLTTGRDVRASGSGNIGATNVLRTTGRAAGIATLLLDIGKGYLAVWLEGRLTRWRCPMDERGRSGGHDWTFVSGDCSLRAAKQWLHLSAHICA